MQAEHHADEPGTARVGLIRGVLVIVTAVAVGAFVLSRGGFGSGSEAVAAGADAVADGSAEGTDTDPEPASDGGDPATATSVPSSTDAAVDDGAPAETTSTTAAADTSTTAATDPAGPAQMTPAEVQVLVLNAEGTKGIAGRGSEVLRTAGYDVLAPKNATRLAATSSILYQAGFEAEAAAVAVAYGADIALVAAYDSSQPPIDDIGQAEVVVLIGQDGALGV